MAFRRTFQSISHIRRRQLLESNFSSSSCSSSRRSIESSSRSLNQQQHLDSPTKITHQQQPQAPPPSPVLESQQQQQPYHAQQQPSSNTTTTSRIVKALSPAQTSTSTAAPEAATQCQQVPSQSDSAAPPPQAQQPPTNNTMALHPTLKAHRHDAEEAKADHHQHMAAQKDTQKTTAPISPAHLLSRFEHATPPLSPLHPLADTPLFTTRFRSLTTSLAAAGASPPPHVVLRVWMGAIATALPALHRRVVAWLAGLDDDVATPDLSVEDLMRLTVWEARRVEEEAQKNEKKHGAGWLQGESRLGMSGNVDRGVSIFASCSRLDRCTPLAQ